MRNCFFFLLWVGHCIYMDLAKPKQKKSVNFSVLRYKLIWVCQGLKVFYKSWFECFLFILEILLFKSSYFTKVGIACGCKLVVGQTNVKSCYSNTSPLHYTSCLNLVIGQAAAYCSCTSFVVLHPVNCKFDLHQRKVSSSLLSRVMNNQRLLEEEQAYHLLCESGL